MIVSSVPKRLVKRAIAIVMGPVMNFILAIVLFFIVVIMSGVFTNVKLDSVLAGKAGEKAGLQKGDIIISIDNQPIGDDREKLVTSIQSSAGKPMTWVMDRAGNPITLQVTPEMEAGAGKLGVVISGDRRSATFSEVLTGTYEQVVGTTIGIVTGLQKLVMLQFKLDDLGGPVRTAQVSAEFAKMGMTYLISWAATLSLYLGIFNLLPIPALDGSRLLFMGLEALRGKPIDPNRESMVHFVGFALLMLLMVAVTYNDILRLIKG